MQKEEAKSIWNRYLTGTASKEEIALLEDWYNQFEHNDLAPLSEKEVSKSLRNVAAKLPLTKKTAKLWPKIAVAASVLIAITAGIWIYSLQGNINDLHVQIVNQKDLPPGGKSATLTLANGKVIELNNAKSAVIISGEKIAYNDNTRINSAYQEGKSQAMLLAQTPRGGEYQVILPDGTKVWLNSSSTLQFPQAFAGLKNRTVILKGEAYFEVAKDRLHPFIVQTTGQSVEVLGTHFNINNYDDESYTKTTLLEGAVSVTEHKLFKKVVISPGQQVTLSADSKLNLNNVNAEQAVAWKNGIFEFYRADTKTVMRTLARWYNVDVKYEGEIPDHEFTGKIFKKVSAAQALSILSELGVKFKIDGRRIIVIPI